MRCTTAPVFHSLALVERSWRAARTLPKRAESALGGLALETYLSLRLELVSSLFGLPGVLGKHAANESSIFL